MPSKAVFATKSDYEERLKRSGYEESVRRSVRKDPPSARKRTTAGAPKEPTYSIYARARIRPIGATRATTTTRRVR